MKFSFHGKSVGLEIKMIAKLSLMYKHIHIFLMILSINKQFRSDLT